MQVGIDITSVIYHRGVSRYTANLVRALQEHNLAELHLYGSSLRQFTHLQDLAEELTFSDSTEVTIQYYPPSVLSHLWKLGINQISSAMPGIDIFHAWDWIIPPDKTIPLVSTIHDLALLKFPETANPTIRKKHELAWKVLKDRDSHIITVSRAAKKDIVEFLEIPPYKVHVVYEALPEEVRDVSETLTEEQYSQIKNQLNLDKPFIFFVGTREPRKNLARLIEAWEPLSSDYQLIIAGEEGWDNTKQIKNHNLRFLGKVSDQQLSVLYAEASAFAYPSLDEGFGLPILEAFHHGTPVVTSNISAMPEVAGNAAELVDPFSVESIRGGLETILNEDISAQQKRLQRMIIRQQMFNWRVVAQETATVYAHAIKEFHAKE